MLQNYAILFEFMELFGKKWVAPLLVFLLFYGQTNFSEIKKRLKLTSRALSRKLKLLQSLGLVEKITIKKGKKALYSLSERGKEMSEFLLKMYSAISQI